MTPPESTIATDFDIAICGAGPVGLALATLLVKRGVAPARIALIDAKTLEQTRTDPRSIALSHGSQQILEEIGAWPIAATAIHQIHVSRRGYFGRTLIDCNDQQVPAFGYVTRYGAIVTALAAACEKSDVVILRPMQVTATTEHSSSVELQIADGRLITTSILVQAEGGLFAEQSNKSLHRDYQQTALLAHVITLY
jgi:2-octaprenyl-6-methoxyphenol hydroxylase